MLQNKIITDNFLKKYRTSAILIEKKKHGRLPCLNIHIIHVYIVKHLWLEIVGSDLLRK